MTLPRWLTITLLCLAGLTLALVILLRRFPHLVTLTQSPQSVLHTTSGRTNILLLGMGGAGHEAPDLTDSLIFISLNPTTYDMVLISLPRDIWVDQLQAKINTAYYYGQQRSPGGGLTLAKTTVSQLLGQPIHYAVGLNFSGFTRALDLVGGIDVDVPQTFDDFSFPIPGKEADPVEANRYEHLHFDAGLNHFDGATALKYVRSRNAPGDQGTDFARSSLQQQVIAAFKLKLFSANLITSPQRFPQLLQIFNQSVIHDLGPAELLAFSKLAMGFKSAYLRSGLFGTGTAASPGLLLHPPVSRRYGSQWVLIPKDDRQLQEYVTNLIFAPR